MLTANLLPLNKKKDATFETWRRVFQFFGVAAALLYTVAITFLAPSYFPLLFQRRELQRSLNIQKESSRSDDPEDARAELSRIRALMSDIRQSPTKNHTILQILNTVAAEREGITILSATIENNNVVTLRGKAALRRNLLDFEQSLRASNIFQEITLPLSSVVRESDIAFTLQGKLNNDFQLQ